MPFSIFGEIADDILTDTIDAVQRGLQNNKLTKLITDVYGMGYRGGAFDGKKANEIIYKDDGERLEIYAYRKWDPDNGESPLSSYSELIWDGNELTGFTSGGTVVKKPFHDMYDDEFSLLGAENVVAIGKFGEGGEETEMREEFVKNALRFYSRRGKPIGNGFYVAEIPFRNRMRTPRDWIANWDGGLFLYYGAQTVNYYIMDWVSTKFRHAISYFMPGFLKKHFREKPKMSEERLRRQYKRFTDDVNKWLGICRDVVIMW